MFFFVVKQAAGAFLQAYVAAKLAITLFCGGVVAVAAEQEIYFFVVAQGANLFCGGAIGEVLWCGTSSGCFFFISCPD